MKVAALQRVCEALTRGSSTDAVEILRREYPFSPLQVSTRGYGPPDLVRLFVRDGFVDRYSGERLVFPPALRALSLELPDAFPYHLHWKADRTHPAFWELAATLDHVVPVALGGEDDESNWVTTSMARNAAKMNFTLEQLGWTLGPKGSLDDWDGLAGWFVEYGCQKPELLENGALKRWHREMQTALNAT